MCVCERETERDREMERERERDGEREGEEGSTKNIQQKKKSVFSSYQLTDIDIPLFKI